MKISVLGTGCAKCNTLAKVAEQAASDLGLEYQLEKITDIEQIVSHGIMMTPGLVVDGKVRVTGRVPSDAEMKQILS